MLGDVLRAGDTLVVWKMDRLARSLQTLIATAEALERQGVGLMSLPESINTTTLGRMLVFHLFVAIAQFERALIRERTAAGLVEARRRGRKGGRPPAFTTDDLLAARALMAEGKLPVRAVAKRIGVSVATLYRHLGRRELTRPKPVRRADHGMTKAAPQAEMERYAEIVAALKVRTSNKKGHRLSTRRAIELLEDTGVETPDELVRAPKGLLKRPTLDQFMRSAGLDLAGSAAPQPRARRPPGRRGPLPSQARQRAVALRHEPVRP